MAIDILNYAVMKKYTDAITCNIQTKVSAGTTTSSVCPGLNIGLSPCRMGCYPCGGLIEDINGSLCDLFQCWDTLCKCLLVCKVPTACGFRVCCEDSCFSGTRSCQWTVPAGVNFAQFQMWGAGGGSVPVACCGGHFFGPTGSYAVVGIPVTAGWTYCICAGQPSICCATAGQYAGDGCTTWVQGCNLCGVCAQGACGSSTAYQNSLGSSLARTCECCPGNSCVYSSVFRIGTGAAGNTSLSFPSNGLGMCTANPCNTSCIIAASDFAFSCASQPYGCVSGTNSYGYGIPGMFPRWGVYFGFTSAPSAMTMHPPIFGFVNSSMCYMCFDSCAPCHRKACCGFLPIPAAGSTPALSVTSDTSTPYGNYGRFGMVCVTFC